MRKPDTFESAYNALGRLASGPVTEESVAELRRAIGGSKSLLVARAAQIAGNRGLEALIPDMIAAFDRLMVNGAKTDKQCNAKIAIAAALNRLETFDESAFLAGAKYIQMEPVFGDEADTAAELRCNCAAALARIGRSDARAVLTDLLVDTERLVRVAAVKALAYLASPESELLLRLKVLTGDAEAEVLSECFASLLVMAPERSLEFVGRYLASPNAAIAECAALSIGESRVSGAFDMLRQCWEDDPSPTTRRMLLLPIALVRNEAAFDFLLDIVRTGDNTTSAHAVTALDLYADDESMRRVREALSRRKSGR